jgi:hypothetical protein
MSLIYLRAIFHVPSYLIFVGDIEGGIYSCGSSGAIRMSRPLSVKSYLDYDKPLNFL